MSGFRDLGFGVQRVQSSWKYEDRESYVRVHRAGKRER